MLETEPEPYILLYFPAEIINPNSGIKVHVKNVKKRVWLLPQMTIIYSAVFFCYYF